MNKPENDKVKTPVSQEELKNQPAPAEGAENALAGIDLSRFTQADTELDAYPAWDFDKAPVLQGTVVKVKEVTVERQGKEVDTKMAVIKVGEDKVLLWEAANLEKFFSALGPGVEVVVQFLGMQPLKGGRSMRMFRAFHS